VLWGTEPTGHYLLVCPLQTKPRLSRGSELRPFYMGTRGRGSQWCNRLLWIIVILRGRFLFWERESERGREVMREG